MRQARFLATLIVGLIWAGSAWATCGTGSGTCFWIGGTGTLNLSSDSAHWSASSGGTTCSCEPQQTGTADGLTFDGSSGGGTVTWAAGPFTIGALTAGAFTGTLAFNTNNPSITLQSASWSGAGARTITCGTATFTLEATTGTIWDNTTVTSETWSCASSNVVFDSVTATGTRLLSPGASKPQGNFTFKGGSKPNYLVGCSVSSAGCTDTFASFTLVGPVELFWRNGGNVTVTAAISWAATSSTPIFIESDSGGTPFTFTMSTSSGTGSWISIKDTTVVTNGVTFSSCTDLGGNTLVTCNAPATTGGAGIIGG